METKTLPQLLVVSGACCSPNLIRQDQILEKALQQALSELGLVGEINKVSLSHVIHGGGILTPKQREQIMALFQAYNVRFTPALFIGDEIRFAGKPPTVDQLKEVLQEVLSVLP